MTAHLHRGLCPGDPVTSLFESCKADENRRDEKCEACRELGAPVRRVDAADRSLPEDDAINAAFPTRSGRHDLYAEALRLVGAKHSKGALVELVNWLLLRVDQGEQRVALCEAVCRAVRMTEEKEGRDVDSLLAECMGKPTLSERLAGAEAALRDCGVNENNPDTCGVCRLHFEDCERDLVIHEDPGPNVPTFFGCAGARARKALPSLAKASNEKETRTE